MSIYKELNNMKLDVTEFEEKPLTKLQEKQWEKRVLNKLHKKKRSKKWLSVAAACIIITSIAVPLTNPSVANVPFIAEPIEHFNDPEKKQQLDYSKYKTIVGETAENEYGKLTLNEVLVDDNNLLIGSTFEPAEGIAFDYQKALIPKIQINGEDLTVTRGGESIEINDAMFTIYNDIELSHLPQTETLQLEISYDTFDWDTVMNKPLVFHIEASQSELIKDKKTFNTNEMITLHNDQSIVIEKVVVTPISTSIYYDATQSTHNPIYFKIVSENGEEQLFNEATFNDPGEISFSRFDSINIEQGKYSLVPYNGKDEVIGEAIPIQ
ncbi:hypothetical protein BAMA_04170 [Bacillus manliponensis]|uniref:Uncharacterized protein n=1 Tax=Bacillus manliponensis TaxID=574376 RepID=A0A073JWN0_9BACI|nr:DUF4179 domain-containing protein [Bacillus manliponensis]KEK18710.1 hypothetical protein BAMA_04170 [Bacillus manliponensis]